MDNNFKMVAKTLFGFEELLAKELRNLGAQEVKIGVRNVSFVGDKGFMYKANLALRTAIKILKPIKTFRVANEQDLYNNIYKMPWEDYMSENGSLAIKISTWVRLGRAIRFALPIHFSPASSSTAPRVIKLFSS